MQSLAEMALFSSMPRDRVSAIEMRCKKRNYEASDLVIDYDDATTDVWFLLSGRLRVLYHTPNDKEFIFCELEGGDFFGEMAAIDGNGRSAHVTALQRSQLVVMPAPVFVDVVTGTPDLSRQVLETLVERVRRLSVKLAEHAYLTAKQRLYSELLRMARPRPNNPENRVISPPPIQRDLANRIGSSRESVSRELKALEKAGIIEQTRGALVLSDPIELNQRISEDLS